MRYRFKRRPPASGARKSDNLLDSANGQAKIWLSDRTFEESADPLLFIESPDLLKWGEIPDCLAPFPQSGQIDSGIIVVPEGNRSSGFAHIVEKHKDKIARLHGGISVAAYVLDVLRHYQRVYRQTDGSLWLIRENGIRKCAVVAPMKLEGKLTYKLITAYPLPREPDFSRRGAVKLIYAG